MDVLDPDRGGAMAAVARRRRDGLWRRLRRDTRGQTIVEFALVVPVLLAMLLGIISLGFYINADLTLAQATRVAVREASLDYPTGLNGSGTNCTQPTTSGTICNGLSSQIALGAGMAASNLNTVCITQTAPSGSNLGTVEVAVTYDYVPVVPLPGVGSSITMSQTYTMVQESTDSYPTTCSS